MKIYIYIVVVSVLPALCLGVTKEPKPIADFESNKIKASLNSTAIGRIIQSRPEVMDLPTKVLSIAGVARSGKSFLLNLMVNLLEYMEQHGSTSGWEGSNTPISGMNWAQSNTTVTHGIWMWEVPYVITKSDGSKVAVLLVDTQGTGDNQRSHKLDTLIMYLSLHISSVQFLNIWKYPTSEDLSLLKLCADYMELNCMDEDSRFHLFQSLVFLLRDYQFGDGFGKDDGILTNMMKGNSDQESRSIINGILNVFTRVTSCKMPFPGSVIYEGSVSQSLKLNDVETQFLATVSDLVVDVLDVNGMVKEDKSSVLTGREQLEKFKDLQQHIEGIDGMTSSTEALEMMVISNEYRKGKKLLKELTSPESLEGHSLDELLKNFNQTTDEIKKNFTEGCIGKKYQSSEFIRRIDEYAEELRRNIEEKYEEMERKHRYEREIMRERCIAEGGGFTPKCVANGFLKSLAAAVAVYIGLSTFV